MSINMHIRDVPEHVHEELQQRAAAAGMTLRQYTVKILEEHVATSTMDEWMERIARRRARWLAEGRHVSVDAAEAVRAARYDDDDGRSELHG